MAPAQSAVTVCAGLGWRSRSVCRHHASRHPVVLDIPPPGLRSARRAACPACLHQDAQHNVECAAGAPAHTSRPHICARRPATGAGNHRASCPIILIWGASTLWSSPAVQWRVPPAHEHGAWRRRSPRFRQRSAPLLNVRHALDRVSANSMSWSAVMPTCFSNPTYRGCSRGRERPCRRRHEQR